MRTFFKSVFDSVFGLNSSFFVDLPLTTDLFFGGFLPGVKPVGDS